MAINIISKISFAVIFFIFSSYAYSDAFNPLLTEDGKYNKYDLASGFRAGINQSQAILSSSSLVSVTYSRQLAVKDAWAQERELVSKTGQGTHPWTEAEKQELLSTGKVKGYEGHHINSVSSNSELAGDPDNIKFVNGRGGHLVEHGGSYKNQTKGPLIMRKKYLENYRWSTSSTNLISGGVLVVTGGIILWENVPDIFANFKLYQNNKDDKRAFWALINSSLFAATGLSSSIAGTAQISAFAVGKYSLKNMHKILGNLRYISRSSGITTVVLAVAEGSVYAYQWKNGYISTPNFVKKLSVTAAAAAGAAAGAAIGSNLGQRIEPNYGQLIGGVGGGIIGGLTGAATATGLIDKSNLQIDYENQNQFLDHLYSYYGEKRNPINREIGPET